MWLRPRGAWSTSLLKRPYAASPGGTQIQIQLAGGHQEARSLPTAQHRWPSGASSVQALPREQTSKPTKGRLKQCELDVESPASPHLAGRIDDRALVVREAHVSGAVLA